MSPAQKPHRCGTRTRSRQLRRKYHLYHSRGVTTNTDPTFGDSPAAFHIDGIYQGRPAAASGLFYDVERVEVLSGPQGTCTGRIQPGHDQRHHNKPTFDDVHGEAEQEFGSYYWTRSFGMIMRR